MGLVRMGVAHSTSTCRKPMLYYTYITELKAFAVVDKLHEAGFSSADWRYLGQRLTPKADLKAIGQDCSCSDDRLEKVVDEFLRDGEDLSWEALAKAVAQCRGGGQNIARKLLTSVEIGMHS